MELEIFNFIRKTIETVKPSLKELIHLVSKEYGTDLLASDISYITENYRLILMELWTDEFVEKFDEKTQSMEIEDDEVIELVGIFRSLKAFEETPLKLRGDIYKLVKKERDIFTSKDFYKPRKEICNVLNHKLMSLSQKTWNEYQLFENLINVLRNSYKDYDILVKKLQLQSFVNGEISVYQVAQNVLANNFTMEKYDVLRDISKNIQNKTSFIQHILRKEIGKFLEKLISRESENGGSKIWLLKKKVMMSKDLNADIGSNVGEIHIVCDIIHIDEDLPKKYRGKNVFLISNTIRLHRQSIWDLSGFDAVQKYTSNAGQYSNGDGKNGGDGELGESGGNCEIFSIEINNGNLWTIKSNGGNGSNGQDGGNGENGTNGKDIQKEDFKLTGEKLTNSNFLTLLNNYGISTEIGSRRCDIFESNLQKQIVFNRNSNKSELLMLIRGSSGTIGALGGFGGICGRGSFAGKINVNCDDKGYKIVAKDGVDGKNGINGFNGRIGRNGRDAYMKISSNEANPKYGGLDKKSECEISFSSTGVNFSIFYEQFNKYLYVAESKMIAEIPGAHRNTPEQYVYRLARDDENFYESLTSVIRNSNKNLKKLIEKLKIKQFLNQEIDLKKFASGIIENNFDIIEYSTLKSYAKFFTERSSKLETYLRDFLQEFTENEKIVQKSGNTYEIAKKIMTSEDLSEISQDFDELYVICDTLHINSNLSKKFQGRNLAINADTINIHKNVEWNLSGHDNFLAIKANCSRAKYFENGGHCIISTDIIKNPSILKIISNGGNASNAQNGVDAEMKDFKINGRPVEDFPYSMKQTFIEGGLLKHLVKQSNSNYLLLIKGSDCVNGYNGLGEKGGLAGYVEFRASGNVQNDEVEVICKNGNNDISREGRDAFLYVNDGYKQYIGLDAHNRYDLMPSNFDCEYSVNYSSKFYFPKFSRTLNEQIGPDSVGKSLYENIIWVLRNSSDRIDHVVTKLGLRKFVNNEISLTDVARNIEPNPVEIDCNTLNKLQVPISNQDILEISNYKDLKKCAKYFKSGNQEDIIRGKIKEFLSPPYIQNSSNILTMKEKICHSSLFGKLDISSNTTEIRLICDTLHIDSELPQNFRGKNFAIYANYVQVHKNVIWNLSGTSITKTFSSDAGQNSDGIGQDGADGMAGKSGGNFSLYCKFIENSSKLTIESNGSDGTDGQNGGNGKEGENGKNASSCDFKKNGVDWRMHFDVGAKKKMYKAYNLTDSYSSVVTMSCGLTAYVYIQTDFFEDWGLILMKGSKGQPGKSGGLPGYGGQGGYSGEIDIKTFDFPNKVKISGLNKGKDGKSGKAGYNGVNGVDGDDNYRYDERNWSNPKTYGNGARRKYKLSFSSDKSGECVYVSSGNYVRVVDDGSTNVYSERRQNTSKVTRQRTYQALAKKCASINMNTIINESSKYLSNSRLNVQKSISTQFSSRISEFSSFKSSVTSLVNTYKSYLQAYSFKISTEYDFKTKQQLMEPTKKSDILVETSIAQYSDYLKVSTNEIEEITSKYSSVVVEIETEEMQVQTEIAIQLKFDAKRQQRSIEMIDSERILYVDILNMLLRGCLASELFEMVRASRFNSKKYKYLADNISSYKIEQTKRYILDKKDILDKSIEKYVQEFGKESKNPVVRKFHDLQVKGDHGWKKCNEDQQVLQNFIQFVKENFPAFLTDFFKNLVKDSYLEAADLSIICEDKFFLIFFREIYSKLVKQSTSIPQSVVSFATNSSEFWDQISYFKDTEDFLSSSNQINKHFKDNGDEGIKEILDYFLLNVTNFDISLPESIFTLLTDHADELDDIADILNEYSSRASDILDEIGSDDEDDDDDYDAYEADYNQDFHKSMKNVLKIFEDTSKLELKPKIVYFRDIRKEKYVEVLKEFFEHDEIIEFIKKDISDLGVNSILYRRILAHKYDVKMTILMKSFDGDYKIVEHHNYDHEMEFQYKKRQDVLDEFLEDQLNENSKTKDIPGPAQELFILLKNGEFSILEHDSVKYETFKYKQLLESQSETIVKILNGENVSNESKEEILKYLDPLVQKYGPIPSKILRIFTNDKFLLTNEALVDIILSNFPYILLKYNQNGVTKLIIDDKVDENIAKLNESSSDEENMSKYKIYDDQEIRDDIKLDLMSLVNINGLSVVKAIAIRLFNDKNSQSLREFSLILKTILDLMSQQKSLKYFMTFMILGNEQDTWSLELALMKLESIYGKFDENLKNKWRINANKTKVKKILELFLEKASELEKTDDRLDESGLDHVIDNMQYFGADNYDNLKNSNLSSWRLMTTEKYWAQELKKLNMKKDDKINPNLKGIFEDLSSKYGIRAKEIMKILHEKRKELPDIDLEKFLGNFNSGVFKFSDESINLLTDTPVKEWNTKLKKYFSTEGGIRNAREIVRLVEIDQETSKVIKNKIKDIGDQAQDVFSSTCARRGKKIIEFEEDEVLEWVKNTKQDLEYGNKPSLIESLAIITRTFQLKNKITLRDTQLMSILTMWHNDNGVLMQVSTGEGKTFIGVSFAILKILYGEKVDIITSSTVLAIRDAEENANFFKFFGISVDHNCHENIEMRKQAYRCQIVYGVLGNFQRDYLLTEFFNENFMSGHHFTNVLVDEVDSMLLDKGNNILYLSSSLPDIDEVESVFLFIWQYVNQGSNDPEEALSLLKSGIARRVVLDNAYGLLEEDDIKGMKSGINSDEIINKLKNSGLIDEECIICDETYSERRFNSPLQGLDEETCEKIKTFCRNKIETKKQIKIPKYLRKFVLLHLNQWIESAVRATYLRNEKEYVVDKTNDGPKLFTDPNIIILDLDTGTDMTNSQWDEGLHQFLQLKHGCRLSLISLKSVFISNVTYFKKYRKLYGMTGTLGNLEERNKTTAIHQIDFVTLPRYVEQRFIEYSSILENDPSLWLEKIHEEVVGRFNENRSVLIICETIQDTRVIRKVLLNNSTIFTEANVHVYQRDTSDFNLGKLEPKHVIIATNLAGRGTDIKLSKPLKESGGLHVILSYLPQNARIENQAFGRASRAGDMGSGRLIICTDSVEANEITKMKETRNHNELQRLDEVNTYYQNFITIEEDFFGKFHAAFRELKKIGNETSKDKQTTPRILSIDFINNYRGFNEAKGTDAIKIYLDNFKLQWSFWLDENSKKLEERRAAKHDMKVIKRDLQNNFQSFISSPPQIHPVKQTDLFKLHNENDFEKAKGVLMHNSQQDIIALQYYKCYEILKKNQIDNGYENRSLTSSEESELTKCLKMLNDRINSRNVRVRIANSIKQQYQDSLISIEAFEKQQKTLNEIDEIFIDSIQNILGRPITPETLITTEIKLDVITKNLHEDLIDQNVINPPKVSNHYTDDDIRIVAYDNKIKFEDLKKFLGQKYIRSMKDYGIKLKNFIKLPSREEFWETLVRKGILTDEVKYAIIDMNVIKNLDPSIYAEIGTTFENEKLTVSSKTEIFFSNINTINEDQGQFKVQLKEFKSNVSSERFEFLMDNGAIQVNKRANFNIQKYEELKHMKIFDNFDEVRHEDFSRVCKNYNKIIGKLMNSYENDRKILSHRGTFLSLNYENIDLIEVTSDTNIFGDDEVYQADISNLLNTKFAYRIALESLVSSIKENVKNENDSKDVLIHLHISPHLMVVNDLIANNIIELAKSDKTKIGNISGVKKMLERRFSNLIGGHSHGFTRSKTDEFLRNNLNKAIEDFESLEKKIKESIQALSNFDIETPDVVLKPLREFVSQGEQHQMLEFMKLKGFDMVMKVELKKYSGTYWWRFAIVMILAITQIVVGALLMVLSKGIFYKIGESLIQEGIGDAIFALGTLKNGHFTWKDYGEHKLISIATTLAFGLARAGLSRVKYLKRFFQESSKINSHILSNLSDNSSTVFQLIKSGGSVGKGTLKSAFKLFASTVSSNVGKAITQAAIGMGADFLMEQFLDETTKRISQFIVDELQKNFWIHDISKTIDKLLQYYSPSDLKEKVLTSFHKISEQQKFWTDIAEKVSNKVDDLLRTGQNISKVLTITTSIVSKLLELSSVTAFAFNAFNHLNSSITDVLKNKSDGDKINNKIKDDDIQKLKQEILDSIKAETTEKFKNAINSTVVKPALSFAANAVVSKASQSFKGLITKHKEKDYSKKAAEIVENSEDGKISEADAIKINKILSKSKNPSTHAALVELDVPMNVIGIEAAAVVLKNALGSGHKLDINYEGKPYEFGDVDNKNAKTVMLNLTKGHFENSKNSAFGNDCMYDAITDKIPALKGIMSPKEFRKQVAATMTTDPKIINEIQDSRRNKYFMDIGFYGGGSGERNRKRLPKDIEDAEPFLELGTKIRGLLLESGEPAPRTSGRPIRPNGHIRESNVDVVGEGKLHNWTKENAAERIYSFAIGSYNAIKNITRGRKGIADIDHIPPDSVYESYNSGSKNDPIKSLKYGQKPCILIPRGLHLKLETTGGHKGIRKEQIELLKQGKFASSVLVNFDAYQKASKEYLQSYTENPRFRISGNAEEFSTQIKSAFNSYIDNISSEQRLSKWKTRPALITPQQAEVLRNFVRNDFNVTEPSQSKQTYLDNLNELY